LPLDRMMLTASRLPLRAMVKRATTESVGDRPAPSKL
jgi:hypothetical protein